MCCRLIHLPTLTVTRSIPYLPNLQSIFASKAGAFTIRSIFVELFRVCGEKKFDDGVLLVGTWKNS